MVLKKGKIQQILSIEKMSHGSILEISCGNQHYYPITELLIKHNIYFTRNGRYSLLISKKPFTMPRKKKTDELNDWLKNYRAVACCADYANYSITHTVLIGKSDKPETAIKRMRELYPDAKDIGYLNESIRISL